MSYSSATRRDSRWLPCVNGRLIPQRIESYRYKKNSRTSVEPSGLLMSCCFSSV